MRVSLIFFPGALIIAYMVRDRSSGTDRDAENAMRAEAEMERRAAEMERETELGPPPLA